MTREEAIAILKEEAEFLYGEDKPHNRTAFDMAIKALSVPEREKGTDLISREAVIDLLNQFGYYDKEMEKDLSVIPSAEREKGIDGTLVYNANGHFYGVMGGDAIMDRMRGKADETN